MNQVKIGKFIFECRKEQNLTQFQLAEKLNITDRAISKWETGRAMPDSSLMLDLCNILNISVNELLSGEKNMEKQNENNENLLLELVKEKEVADRRLLRLEVFIGILSCIILFGLLTIAIFIDMKDWTRIVIIIIGFILFVIGCLIALRIEQVAGYYECKKCGHRYVPSYLDVNMAMHIGRSRYLKCPKCGKKSWNKKVISKE